MKLWIYCDNCEKTRPLLDPNLHLNKVGDWKDLCCGVCRFVIATISAGDDEGHRPPTVDR